MTLSERFWAKVDKRGLGECWEWRGATTADGYGWLSLGGRNGPAGAHRISWNLHKGSIPDNLWVLHRCDNPRCVNPEHLFLGTTQDNTADMVAKGRHRPPPYPIGEQQWSAKLTAEKVRLIRSMADNYSHRDISSRFSISKTQVARILCGKSWRHVLSAEGASVASGGIPGRRPRNVSE